MCQRETRGSTGGGGMVCSGQGCAWVVKWLVCVVCVPVVVSIKHVGSGLSSHTLFVCLKFLILSIWFLRCITSLGTTFWMILNVVAPTINNLRILVMQCITHVWSLQFASRIFKLLLHPAPATATSEIWTSCLFCCIHCIVHYEALPLLYAVIII